MTTSTYTVLMIMTATVCFLAAANAAMAADPQTMPAEERLWPGDAPGSDGVANTERVDENGRVSDVSVPTLSYYPAPKDKATGTAIIVCPGGGFSRLAINHEGRDVAAWLNSNGITAVLLKYRVGKQIKGADEIEALSVADGIRAIRIVRSKAAQLGVRPDRIGIMGFSAGGAVAGRLVARIDDGKPDATDLVDRVSCRPDFAVLVYSPPIPTLDAKTITKNTPPIFMIHAADDGVPREDNARLFQDLHKAGIPVELHIFATGGHGFGLGNRGGAVAGWPKLFAQWLTDSQRFADTFTVDYLAPLGGEDRAILATDSTVAYANAAGVKLNATVEAVSTDAKGILASHWSKENLGRRVGYAFCYIRSDKDQQAQCYFGGSDEARVWVNGKLLVKNDNPRDMTERKDSFKVELKKGLNPVMVKTSQRTGMWLFKFEVLPDEKQVAIAATQSTKAAPTTQPLNELSSKGQVTNWLVINFHIEKPEH